MIDDPKLMLHHGIANVICEAHPPLPQEMCCIVQDRKQVKSSWTTVLHSVE